MSKITDFVITNFEMLAKIYGIVAIIVCVAVILFMIWVVKAEDEERKLYGDDYYLPEMEELPSTAETVIFTLMLAVGCGIAWIVIPLLIIGVMLQEKISKNFPELMGKIFEETEEENK